MNDTTTKPTKPVSQAATGQTSKTKVIFRKWHSGSIIALFPALAATVGKPWYCLSYEHVGQHGAADPQHVIALTEPATAEESAELAAELIHIGYVLNVKQRTSSADYAARKLQLSWN